MSKANIKKSVGFWSKIKGYRLHLSIAFVFDLLSGIPWVGMIFTFLGYLTLWLWLEMDGVKPSLFSGRKKAKKAASFAGNWILSIFGLGIIPLISVWVYLAVAEHAEMREESEISALQKTQEKLNSQRETVNQRIPRKRSAYNPSP